MTTERVSLCEVSLRDGLQNERGIVSTEHKRELFAALSAASLERIELTSFVSPRWVPQLADAEALARAVGKPPGVRVSALVPNARGLERALAAGIEEVAVFVSASDSHNRKNMNMSLARTMALLRELVPRALAAGRRVRAYVSTVWGCPFEGAVDPNKAVAIAAELASLGCYQISLGDTLGVGNPAQTRDIVRRALVSLRAEQIALHLHDTRGTALANILAALDLGVRDFDASVSGLGGCPYAPGAAGNVATEDLVFMLEGMGLATGVDLDRLIAAGHLAERIIGRPLPGKVHRAGAFRA